MFSPHQIITANDNDPPTIAPLGDSVGFRSHVLDRQRQYIELQQREHSNGTQNLRSKFLTFELPLLVWFGTCLAMVFCMLGDGNLIPRVVSAVAVIWSSLWLTYVAQDHGKPRWSEIGTLSALGGFLILAAFAASIIGIPVAADTALMGLGMTTLCIALLLRSSVSLTISICTGFLWIAQAFDGALMGSTFFIALPVLILLQVCLSGFLRQNQGLLLSTLAAYLWLGVVSKVALDQSIISPLYLSTGMFLIGSAHYRLSKAAEDMHFGNMSLHIGLGWVASIIALLLVQHFLIFPDMVFWSGALESNVWINTVWLSVVGICLAVIALSGILRRRHARMFMSSIFLMTAMCASIPLGLLYFDPFSHWIAEVTNLPADIALSGMLGGTVLASALFFMLNNIRRSRFILVAFGLILLAVQARLLLANGIISADQVILIGISFFTALIAITLMGHVNEERRLQSRNFHTQRVSL